LINFSKKFFLNRLIKQRLNKIVVLVVDYKILVELREHWQEL